MLHFQQLDLHTAPGDHHTIALQDKGFNEIIKDMNPVDRLSIIRASGLGIEAPDGTMLTTLGPDIKYLLNIVNSGKALVLSRVLISLMKKAC